MHNWRNDLKEVLFEFLPPIPDSVAQLKHLHSTQALLKVFKPTVSNASCKNQETDPHNMLNQLPDVDGEISKAGEESASYPALVATGRHRGEPHTSPGLPAIGPNLVLQSKHHPASSVRHQNLLCYREDTVVAPRESDMGIPMDKASTHHAKVHVSKAAAAGGSEGHHYCQVKSSWKMFSFTCGTAHLTCHHCLLVLLQPECHIWLSEVLSSRNLSVA